MLKKLFSIAALTSLLVGGLSATQANAAAPTVDPDNVIGGSTYFNTELTSRTETVIPANLNRFTIEARFNFNEDFISAFGGQTINNNFSMSLPDGTAVSQVNGSLATIGYTRDNSGNVNTGVLQASVNYQTSGLTIPATITAGYTAFGYYSSRVFVTAPTGTFLPAGTYNFSTILTANGIPLTNNETGLTADPIDVGYNLAGPSFTTPVGASYGNIFGTLCLDTTKVSVGDVVRADVIFDGAEPTTWDNSWKTKTGYKERSDSGYREFNDATIEVTQYDIDFGVSVRVGKFTGSLVPESVHTVGYRLATVTANDTDTDVSGNCIPAKPSAPVASLFGSSISASGSFGIGSSAQNGLCAAYETSAPNVIAATSYASRQLGSSNYTCTSFFGLLPGKSYVVKFKDEFDSNYSEYSDASQPVTMPTPGYTITSSIAGVVEAGKIVKVSDNVLPIENIASFTQFIPDGKGGFFILGTSSGCNPVCGQVKLRFRHGSATSFDSTFAGTGTVLLDNLTPAYVGLTSVAYFGTNKDKWIAIANGQVSSSSSIAATQIVFGNESNATTTTKTLANSDVNPICEAASTGYVTRPGAMQISAVGAPTPNPTVVVTCYKDFPRNDGSGNSSALQLPVLASLNVATGALTYLATLGSPSADANNFSQRMSINPNAASGEAMFTSFVTSQLVTRINDFPAANEGTIANRSVIRIDSAGNVLSTTNNAWGTAGGSIATDLLFVPYGINSGKVYGYISAGSNITVLVFGPTGPATSIAVDVTASGIPNPGIQSLGGSPVPSNENLLPVAVRGINRVAAGWINLTTGALTTGEVLTYTQANGNGVTLTWFAGADKNTYLVYTDARSSEYLSVLKWIDSRYSAPVGPVPAVTSKDVKYSKNTPSVGAKLTLTGTNLDAVISAKIGENVATIGTKSATSLQLTIPTASASGTVDITLTTAGGDTIVDTFTYVGTGVAQTVTVGALASSVTVGDADLALSATVAFSPLDAGTAGAITWSSDTPSVCSIVANKARLLTAGTCTVKATAAASGLLLAGSGTQSTTVSAATVVAAAQTVTLTGPTKVVVDLDGFDVTASASSRLPVVYASATSAICTVTSAGRVVAIAAGTCEITASQAGNASWLPATKTLTITVAKTPTTPLTEKGDIKKPLLLSKTGTYLKSGDTSLSWNRAKGTLAMKLTVVYIGPIKASVSFKVGTKTYTCSSSFGLTKKQSASKYLTLAAPNLCTGKTEKTQLAALKKITTSTVVTVTVVRDMYLPTTYKKVRTKTRILYAKLG